MTDQAWIGDGLALLDRLPEAVRPPLVAFVVALAGWALLRLVAMVATRPPPVRPGPPTQDLPGDEPPAVVNLLVSGWSVTEDAAEATLLDLAARGYLELRQPDADPRHTTVHVTADDPDAAAAAAARQARVRRVAGAELSLTVYERLLLEHVGRIAVGGVVPLTALAFRDPRDAHNWSDRFAKAVVADARQRGLVRGRVPAWLVTLLELSAVGPAAAFSWFFWELDHRSDHQALFVGVVPLMVLLGIGVRRGGLRGTVRGRETAARWMGLRAYLVVDRAFAELPPSAVAVWDRYLAYGDALGVTHVCSAALDLGLADRSRVWSSYGGAWRQVRVRYPGTAARYGATAGSVVVRGLVAVVVGAGLVWLHLRVVPDLRATPSGAGPLPGALPEPLATPVTGVVAALLRWTAPVAVVGGLAAVRGFYGVVRAVADLVTPRTIRGEVLWVAPWKSATKDGTTVPSVHYLAVDDGRGDRTTAWAMPIGITRGFGAGDVVELTVRPWTRRVTTIGVVQSRRVAAPAPTPPVVAGAPSDPAGAPLTPDELGERLGVRVTAPHLMPAGASRAWMYPLASGGESAVLVSVGSGRPDHLVLGLHRSGEAVRGLGDEAYVAAHGAVARSGDVVVRVAVPTEATNGQPLTSGAFVAVLGAVLSRLPHPTPRPLP